MGRITDAMGRAALRNERGDVPGGGVRMFRLRPLPLHPALRLRERAHDGLLAERITGMQLNRLVAEGCRVLHDVPAPDFNIDHVVVAPGAVYAVETKSFRKPTGIAPDQACRVV